MTDIHHFLSSNIELNSFKSLHFIFSSFSDSPSFFLVNFKNWGRKRDLDSFAVSFRKEKGVYYPLVSVGSGRNKARRAVKWAI